MAAVTYKVKKGDTLSEIAVANNTTVNNLLSLNPDITNKDLIYVGQVIIISGSAATKTTTKSQSAKVTAFGLQSNTDRTVFATWAWSKSNTDGYQVRWKYSTGDGVWFEGSDSKITSKQSIYNAPENATSVAFYVKPISKTYKSGNKDVTYWSAGWSKVNKYSFSDNPPAEPPTPSNVTIENRKLTVKLENLTDLNADEIQFHILKNGSTFKTGKASITNNQVSYSCTVDTSGDYRVRCRSYRDGVYSSWSDYSSDMFSEPDATQGIYLLSALSETSVNINWYDVAKAESYEVQYTTVKSYFDVNPAEVKSHSVESVVGQAIITGLETGKEYFFRVRAITKSKEGAWSDIESVVIGKAPAAPTTWSSTTTAISGNVLTLYWVHNSIDGSSQTYAQLELTIAGKTETHTIQNSTDEETKDKTSFYIIDTSAYPEGTKIQWRVKTAGILTDDNGDYKYSEWSVQRTVDVYATPTVSLSVTNANGEVFDQLESFPIKISAIAGPNTQKPIGHHISVTANSSYETIDEIGNQKMINSGSAVYSRFFDTSDNPLNISLSAVDLDLKNNISYKITCTVSMNSGLTAVESQEFTVAWTDEEYWPDAEIAYDKETYTTNIRPYCVDENGDLIEGLKMSVYRREFDGSFTELITGLDNTSGTYITDPHPALDYARYRVVAISSTTGAVSFYDVPGYPINEDAAILQWDEQWSNFDVMSEDPLDEPAWTGSLLRLPYNLDVDDKYSPDVEFVNYIGRKHPVGYYGTQVGHTQTWKAEIVKSDVETLHALRRLARWMGNVYVREPSGSGYWANVVVSFSQTHCELTTPVSLEITRVEGGV